MDIADCWIAPKLDDSTHPFRDEGDSGFKVAICDLKER
jgi:hypothetical protein